MRFLLAFLATFLAAALAPTGAAAARSPIHVRRVETADLRGSVESLADMVRKVRAGLPSSLQGGKNGAAPCAACTVVLGIVEQVRVRRTKRAANFFRAPRVCAHAGNGRRPALPLALLAHCRPPAPLPAPRR